MSRNTHFQIFAGLVFTSFSVCRFGNFNHSPRAHPPILPQFNKSLIYGKCSSHLEEDVCSRSSEGGEVGMETPGGSHTKCLTVTEDGGKFKRYTEEIKNSH